MFKKFRQWKIRREETKRQWKIRRAETKRQKKIAELLRLYDIAAVAGKWKSKHNALKLDHSWVHQAEYVQKLIEIGYDINELDNRK